VKSSDPWLVERIRAATGKRPERLQPLPGGCIAEVFRIDLAGGDCCVAKRSRSGGLAIEAEMLRYLARESDLPVPAVILGDDDLLLLEYIETAGPLDGPAETHAADLLAALHGKTAPAFGFERDTVIGPLPQPNPWSQSWIAFFRDQRLIPMGRRALDSGNLPAPVFGRLEAFAGRLAHFLTEPAAPSLIHGDVWGGNLLVRGGRIAAFIDPAIYYADPEIELAYGTLFGTLGDDFFRRYRERRALAPGFFEARRDIYNLYPLLVHTTLFGGSYAASVDGILRRYG